MSQARYISCRFEDLPRKTGVLQGYHAELVLELIVQWTNNNEEGCEEIYGALERIEVVIAELEAEAVLR